MAELALVARNEKPLEARKAAPDVAPARDAPAEAAPSKSKKKRATLIGGIAAVLLLVGGGLGYQYNTVWAHEESTDNAYVRADITPIAAKVEGYVDRLMVNDNQRVKAGEVLMIIEPADYQAKVARAEAELARAHANLQTLIAARGSATAQVGAQGGAIQQAQAQVAAAQATAARASADEARFAALAKQGWTTRARLDQARAEALAARAQIVATQAAVAAQRGQEGALVAGTVGAEASIAAGRADVQAADAALRTAQLDLQRTDMRAPFDGIVGTRAVRAGQLVKAGQQLLVIVPVQTSYVVANFKETQLGRMKVGQPVEIKVDAYPGLVVHGRIDSVSPASGAQFALIPTDSASGNFTKIVQRIPVKIAVEKHGLAAQLLRPGLSVEATVDTRG